MNFFFRFRPGFAGGSIGDDTGHGQCDTEIESTLFAGKMDSLLNGTDTVFASDRQWTEIASR